MSELSELIEINRNIERQNDEIIRLLKKIAGEEESEDIGYVKMGGWDDDIPGDEFAAEIVRDLPVNILENDPDIGEVYFIEEKNIFKLTVKNNETTVDNMTGSAEAINFKCQELIANESIKRNQPIPNSTVILSKEQTEDLPGILKMCYEQGAKNVYIPWYSMTQLIGAPETIMTILKLEFYKTEEQLLEKVFDRGE